MQIRFLLLTGLGAALCCAAQAQDAALTPVQTNGDHALAEGRSMSPGRPVTPSTHLVVSLPAHPALTLTLPDLQSMPQTTVAVFNAHTKQNESYSGPLVADVLAKAGVTLSEKTQHEMLDSYVLASGTDGYFVVFSSAELQPGLHKAQAIIAIAQAGQPLTRTGAFQLVDPLDVKPARWVRNLTALSVVPVAAPGR